MPLYSLNSQWLSLKQTVRAFTLGVLEFRSDVTTHFDGELIETYDLGRELAHKVTLRRWDN